jgi:hypothetical protein
MQFRFSVECGEIRAIVRDERVILPADSGHQLPILVPAKPEEVHVFTSVPGVMRQGDERSVQAFINRELHQLARGRSPRRRGGRLAHDRMTGRPRRGNALTYMGANSAFSRVSAG